MSKSIAFILLLTAALFACSKKEAATSTSSATSTATTQTTATTAEPPPAIVNTTNTATASTATASAAPAVAAPAGIASADGETNGVKVVVQELKRTSGGTVAMKFTIANGSDKAVGGGYDYGDKDHEIIDHGSVGGVQL